VKTDERDENDSDGSAQASNSHVGVSVMHDRSCNCAWILALIVYLLMMSNRLVLMTESIVKFDLS
jgi:hypothetical protein